jgi:hypothetical protein
MVRFSKRANTASEPLAVDGLTFVVVADTPYIASAVLDSLPAELPFFLIGPKKIAFLGRAESCRRYFVNDLSLCEGNKADFIQTIERLCTHSNIFLIPADDSANQLLYSTFDRLGAKCYPMCDSDSFEILNDKWRFQQLCSKLGVRVPKTMRLIEKSEIDFDHVRATAGLPFVVKPTNKSDSIGVRVIFSKDQLEKEILLNPKYKFSPLVAQTFIPGIDIDISLFADSGSIKKFAVQTRKEDALFFVQNEKLVEFTEVLVRNLGYTGVLHIDARLDDASGEIFLVEANPRFWGSLGEATWCGLNFVRVGIYNRMGLESPDPTTIFDMSVPSIRRLLKEVATGRQSFLHLSPQQRLRFKHVIRDSVRAMLHL